MPSKRAPVRGSVSDVSITMNVSLDRRLLVLHEAGYVHSSWLRCILLVHCSTFCHTSICSTLPLVIFAESWATCTRVLVCRMVIIIWWESKALNARAARWYFCIPLQMQSQSVCYCYPWRHSLLELRWNILEVPSYELHICAITTHSMRRDWPKIWHKNYYDFNLLQNRHFTTDFL